MTGSSWLVYLSIHNTPFQEIIHQLTGRIIHLHVERFDLAGKVVEHHYSGNGNGKAQRGRDQRFRDSAGNGAYAGSVLSLNFAEGVNDADDRPQQPDERRG